MNIKINHTSQTPIYMQIKNQLKEMILKGELRDGFMLPSERAMAKIVDVHRNTIIKAYDQLVADDLIEASQGLGYKVTYEAVSTEKERSGAKKKKCSKLVPWENLIKDEFLDMETTFDDLFSKSRTGGNNISFAAGITPSEAYSRDDMNKILAEIISEDEDTYAYTPYQGLYALRQALSFFMKGKGINVKPGEIQVASEANQAIDYLTELLIRPGDVVITGEPISPDAYRELKLKGAKVITVPMDEQGMLTDRIEPLIEKHHPKFIYVDSSFHDPTGVVMSLERREALLELSYRHKVPIIEDDGASEIRFEDVRIPSLKSLDKGNNVIYIYSFALTFAPGVGMALVAAPRTVIKSLSYLISVRLISLDSISQRLLRSYLEKGIYQKNLERLCKLYGEKRDLMCEKLEEAEERIGIRFVKPKGGIYIWCRLPENMDSKKLIERAGKKGVTFIPGNVFYPFGSTGDNYIRLNYSYPRREQIAEGMDLLIAAMEESLLSDNE